MYGSSENNKRRLAANVYAVDELARELGISRQSCYRALSDGTIPGIRIGKRYVIPRSAVQAWLASAGGRLPSVTA